MGDFGKVFYILGLGVSGRGAAEYLLLSGNTVVAFDHNAGALLEDPIVKILVAKGLRLYPDRTEFLTEKGEVLVLSPGIPPEHPICRKVLEMGMEVLGEMEFACRELSQNNAAGTFFVGVTGTNGKTTVTSQIAHTLNFFGIDAKPYGNIGTPLTKQLLEKNLTKVIVLELSSYQLETMQCRLLDAALFLNLTPDHLDRYPNMLEYGRAKARIGACLKEGCPFYISKSVGESYPALFEAVQTSVFDDDHIVRQLPAMPPHELQNFAAVLAICSLWGLTRENVQQAALTFKKAAHRIQFVDVINEVSFYDDSKGTNMDAVVKAVASLEDDVCLIAGGLAKGASFVPWKEGLKGRVKAIFTIGEASGQIFEELGNSFPVLLCETMQEAVNKAFAAAKPGGVVLLSPGCSSFDMFRDYKHRGEVFQQCVRELAKDVEVRV